MGRIGRLLFFGFLLSSVLLGQQHISEPSQSNTSTPLYANTIVSVSSLPVICSPITINIVFLVSGLSQGLYYCSATDVWTKVGSGSGGGGSSITLEANGTALLNQANLNLENGNGVSLTNPIAGTVSFALEPPTASVLGGVLSSSASSNQFANGINTSGQVTYAQPTFNNISGQLLGSQLPADSVTFTGSINSGDCAAWVSAGVIKDIACPSGAGGGSGHGGYAQTFTNVISVSIPGSTHALGTSNLAVTVLDNESPPHVIQPEAVTIDPATYNVAVYFATAESGTVILVAGGGSNRFIQSFTSATSWSIPETTHKLGANLLQVKCYDSSGNMVEPASLNIDSSGNVTVDFAQAQAGKVVIE